MTHRSFATLSRPFLCLAFLILTATAGFAQSFTVSANPQSLTVYPGETNVPVTISVSSSTYTGPVNVTLSGLPTGITLAPAPLTLTPGGTGTLMLNVGVNADQEAFPAANPTDPNSATNTVTVIGSVGSTTATSTLKLTVSLSNPNFAPAQGQITLPIVKIDTSGTPVTSGSVDVPGTISITSADGSTSYLPNSSDADNTATFHVHGNTTALMPKLPYHIHLNTSIDLLGTMGLSCPYVTNGKAKPVCDKAKKYHLLANYDDKTLLRDWAASALANAIPYGGAYLDETPVPSPNKGVIPTPSGTSVHMPWAPHSLFVELYLNGAYEGVYQLIEDETDVDAHKLNITELAATDNGGAGDDITGGYIGEIDQHQDEDFVFHTPKGLPIGLINPDFGPGSAQIAAQDDYISSYIDNAETALFSSSFTDPTTGWRAYYDEASAINFYLVNDVMGNVDGGDFYSSTYVYKAIDNPFLYMGPIWDFDISSGNVNYFPIDNPTVPWMQVQAIWYTQFFKDPGFKADVIKQFNTLKSNGVFSNWIASISQQAANLEQAQANNFARWPMVGEMVWPNPEAAGSYDGEVAYLTNYLNLRVAYLDSLFNGKAKTSTSVSFPSGTLYLGAPAQLTAHVIGSTTPTGTVSFFSGSTVIGTGPLDGTGTANLTTSSLRLGSHTISAVYNGDSNNALSSSAATTVNVVQPLVSTVTSLASSAVNAASGATVTLSVSVVGNSGSTTPTGTITFTSNGSTIGTAPLASGTASFATTTLPNGTDSIQALYSGDAAYKVSTSNSVPVTVAGNGVKVTVGTIPSGLAYTVDGTTYNTPQTLSLNSGTTHTLSTTSPQTGSGTQSTFTGWSDGGAQTHSITVPATATSYTASFLSAYLLQAGASPSAYGTVAVSPAGSSGYYGAGTVVTLTATAKVGYTFTGWTGNVANANAVATTVTMNSPQTVSANFAAVSGGGSSINYGNGFTAAGLQLNGSAAVNGTRLQLTGGTYQAGSAFATSVVSVQAFTNDFTFQLSNPTSDGIMFVLQNQGANALGAVGQDLGYGSGSSGIQKSAGIKFDLYNNSGEGSNSTGLFANGTRPTTPSTDLTPSGVNLHSGDVFHVHVTYDGTTLTVLITDTVTGANAIQSYPVNLPSVLGATTAYAGFTSGTGTTPAPQNILSWTYSPGAPAATIASPTFSPVGGTYFSAQTLTLSDATPGASIYYTLDGSAPSASSRLYSGPLAINATTTVNAVAILNGTSSLVTSATYTISSGIGYGGGFTSGGLQLNGSAGLNGNKLRLTNGNTYQAASAFSTGAVGVQAFTNDFTFQLTNPSADGFMFVLQNQGATALGGYGIDLGYGTGASGIQRSVGIKFDIFNNDGEGVNSTGLYINGARPTTPATDLTPSGINLHSGDVFRVHMAYNGSTLAVTITDTVTGATATQNYTVNIPSVVGASSAFAGFTAGTGGAGATQDILNWSLTPGTPAATTASPTFSPIGGTYFSAQSVTLSDATSGASIYYTLDGTTPTASSTLYSSPIAVSASETVKAVAILNGVPSPVANAAYTISSGAVGYGSGFTAGGLSLNGTAALSGNKLRLTNGATYQAASAFSNSPVSVQSFTNDFTFQITNPSADGLMFVLQDQGLSALGGIGIDLGYGNGASGIQRSVGIKFDIYNNDGEGINSTGLYINGARPTAPATDLTSSGVNLHSGNPFHVHMVYNGSTLAVTITDTVTSATATQNYTVNIPSVVGANAAFAGFTAGTGGLSATQDILTWTLTTP